MRGEIFWEWKIEERFCYVDRRRMEEMKIIAEQERNERLAERQRKIDAGEPVDDEDETDEKGWIIELGIFSFHHFSLYV